MVIRRCSALAAMISTSSTPASAAMVSTCSMMRWRMSGRRMLGSGSDTSSKAIVSRIPAKSRSGSGSLSTGCSRASRTAPSTSAMPGSDSGG